MMMTKKRKQKKINNKVSSLAFGQFWVWEQKKKNLRKVKEEVIPHQLTKK